MTEPPPNTSGRGLLLSYIRQADVSPVPAGCRCRARASPSSAVAKATLANSRVAALDADIARIGDGFLQGGSAMEWEYLLLTARKA